LEPIDKQPDGETAVSCSDSGPDEPNAQDEHKEEVVALASNLGTVRFQAKGSRKSIFAIPTNA
jgi:hypothetical protein